MGDFHTTRWSVVRAAGAADSGAAREALRTLCEDYWFPLYAFVRRAGHTDDDARDLTQSFLARLLEKRDLRADPERGRFRAYLVGALKHFLGHERERATAEKRGGGRPHVSLEFDDASARYDREPVERWTPEKLFERSWALALLDRTLERLATDYRAQGKGDQFERLRPVLTGDDGDASRRELAAKLGLSEGALNVAVHRLRKRYRACLLAEIADTVQDPADVEDELRHLFAALDG